MPEGIFSSTKAGENLMSSTSLRGLSELCELLSFTFLRSLCLILST